MSSGTGTGTVNLNSNSGTLGSRMTASADDNINWDASIYAFDAQAHHLIPAAALSSEFTATLQQAALAANCDFDINDKSNGAYLPDSPLAQADGASAGRYAAQHRGPHAQYSNFVTQLTDNLADDYVTALAMGGDPTVEAENSFPNWRM